MTYHRNWRYVAATSAALVCSMTLASDDYLYAIFPIDAPDDYSNVAWGVNDSGVAVGTSIVRGYLRGFVSDGRSVIELGTFGGRESKALDINNDNVVVGFAYNGSGIYCAFRWTFADGLSDLGTLGGPGAIARGINNNGEIVGASEINDEGRAQAFHWDEGRMTNLGALVSGLYSNAYDINESGVIVGEGDDANGTKRPVMWKDNEIIDLGSLGDGTHSGTARGINDRDQVVGQSDDDDHKQYPFLWTGGVMYKLGYRPGLATDINNDGKVVGLIKRGDQGAIGAFIWQRGTGMRYLDDLIAPRAKIRLEAAEGISLTGIIVADGPDPDSCQFCFRTFRLVPVNPELTLSEPVPGLAGEVNTWTITGAQPGSKIIFTYSRRGGGTVVPGCDKLDAVLQINNPTIMKSAVADANGEATIQMYVPPAAKNVGDILFQAVSVKDCQESQLNVFRFQ